ncbi:hypothetical protein [Spirosoma arcticum]
MKTEFGLSMTVLVGMLCIGCTTRPTQLPIVGTWELVAATTTEKDTTFSTFDSRNKFVKIINPTHFAFLNHSLRAKEDTNAGTFTAGGGAYTLVDSVYTESLDYYIDRKWENNKFDFVVTLKGDTLVQKGVEKLDKLGIDRVIVETYKRVK